MELEAQVSDHEFRIEELEKRMDKVTNVSYVILGLQVFTIFAVFVFR